MTLALVGMQILLRVNYIERKNGEQSRLCRGLVLIPIILGVCLGYGMVALHTSRIFYRIII